MIVVSGIVGVWSFGVVFDIGSIRWVCFINGNVVRWWVSWCGDVDVFMMLVFRGMGVGLYFFVVW